MARALIPLLLAFSALALIAIACSGGDDFLLEDEPNATGTPPFFERSPQPTPTPTPTAAAIGECGETYTVEAGDSPFSIAEKCGVDMNDLQELNGIDDPRNLKVGQELKMPPVLPASTATPTPAATPAATPTPTGDAE